MLAKGSRQMQSKQWYQAAGRFTYIISRDPECKSLFSDSVACVLNLVCLPVLASHSLFLSSPVSNGGYTMSRMSHVKEIIHVRDSNKDQEERRGCCFAPPLVLMISCPSTVQLHLSA